VRPPTQVPHRPDIVQAAGLRARAYAFFIFLQAASEEHRSMRTFLFGMLAGALPCLALAMWAGSHPVSESNEAGRREAIYQGKPLSTWLLQLEDHDPGYRREAIGALEKIAPSEPSVVSAVSGALKDQVPLVRIGAACALRRLGAEARPALPALLAAVDDDNQLVRSNVVAALARIEPHNESVLTALARALKDESPTVRRTTLDALGEIGRGAKELSAAVREALADPDPDVRQGAAEALSQIERDKE
jgi:hypothetical protein